MKRRSVDKATASVAPPSIFKETAAKGPLGNQRFAATAAIVTMLGFLAVPAVITFANLGGSEGSDTTTSIAQSERATVAVEAANAAASASLPQTDEPGTGERVAREQEVAETTTVAAASEAPKPAESNEGVDTGRWASDTRPVAQTEAAKRAERGETASADGALAFADNSSGVEVPTSEADTTKLESEQDNGAVARPDDQTARKADEKPRQQQASRADGLRPATTRSAVNMRAEAKSGSAVLMVIPANAAIRTDPNCSHWCKTEYNGAQGYIYKSFIAQSN